jgi:hypothetical protein
MAFEFNIIPISILLNVSIKEKVQIAFLLNKQDTLGVIQKRIK